MSDLVLVCGMGGLRGVGPCPLSLRSGGDTEPIPCRRG